ncbi:MAG: hypothetical protein J5I28_07895 [Acidimicrobiales bacterium]|nr:hypothetical protein [Acidimicrobiales bacterium]
MRAPAARERVVSLERGALDVILEHQGELRASLYSASSSAQRRIEAAVEEAIRVINDEGVVAAAAAIADEPESVSGGVVDRSVAQAAAALAGALQQAADRENARRAYIESVIRAGGFEARSEQEREKQSKVSEQRAALGYGSF